ncbi:MAG: hypothetical protein ACI9OJ_001513 [Myxococcota bacterium]
MGGGAASDAVRMASGWMGAAFGLIMVLQPLCAGAAGVPLDIERENLTVQCPNLWEMEDGEPGRYTCPTPDGPVLVWVRRDPQEFPGEIYGRSAYEITPALLRSTLRLPAGGALEVRDTDLPLAGSQYARIPNGKGGFAHAFIYNRAVDPLERLAGQLASFWPYTGRGYGYAFILFSHGQKPPSSLTSLVGTFEVRDERGMNGFIHGVTDLRAFTLTLAALLLMALVWAFVLFMNQTSRRDHAKPSTAASLMGLLVVGTGATLALVAEVSPWWVLGEATAASIAPLLAGLISIRTMVLDHVKIPDDDPVLLRTRSRVRKSREMPRYEEARTPRVTEAQSPPRADIAETQRRARDAGRNTGSHATAFVPPRPTNRKDGPES